MGSPISAGRKRQGGREGVGDRTGEEGEHRRGGSHERPPPTGYGYQSGGSGRQQQQQQAQEGFRKLAAGLG